MPNLITGQSRKLVILPQTDIDPLAVLHFYSDFFSEMGIVGITISLGPSNVLLAEKLEAPWYRYRITSIRILQELNLKQHLCVVFFIK